MSLEPASGGPLYQQLRQELFARIRREEFAPGDFLPSENQLCEEYGVSLTTARRALLELVKEGVVRRRVGVGTMVAPRVRAAHLAMVSIDEWGDAWRRISSAMGELVAGIGELAWQRSASFSMFGVDEEGAEERLRSLVEAREVDGILLRAANDIQETHLALLESAGIPYVVIKRQMPGRAMNCVVSDDFLGARLATTHLLERGHTRIAFVCARPALTLTQERLAGYRDALEAADQEFDERLVRVESSFHNERGYQAVRELLHLPDRPTALFVASDTMAIGGYQAAREAGFSIPGDVAFIGYDDISPVALLQPPLTTVRTAYYDFGRLATELLLDLIDGQKEAPQRVVMQPELVVRGSTGAPPEMVRSVLRPGVRSALSSSQFIPNGVAVVGRQSALNEAIAVEMSRDGAAVMTPAWRAVDVGEVDAVVCACDFRRDLEENLAASLADGEAAACALAKRRAGVLVLVALGPSSQQGPGIGVAARAGFEQMTTALAARWATRGIRVNAIFVMSADLSAVVGPCQFLISNASAAMSGQVLAVSDASAT
ncbi:MAG TPA: substrate-binding domain-containing protein [Ktedonobacterales bacterium]|nr:substrate-binding domain-containing protein [Ktedonobacterales bacterium]